MSWTGRQIHRVIIFDISMVHFAPKKNYNLNCILSCAQILQRFSSLTISSTQVSVIKDPESTEWISRLQGLTKQETQGERNKEFIFGTSCIRNLKVFWRDSYKVYWSSTCYLDRPIWALYEKEKLLMTENMKTNSHSLQL